MAKHSITEAAQLAGKDHRTIQRHVKSGTLSKETDEAGRPVIDTAELARVYGPLNLPQETPQRQTDTMPQRAAPGAAAENELLRAKLEAAERERDQWKQQAEKAEQREREARAQAEKMLDVIDRQTRLLSASPSPSEQEARPGFWRRVFGRR